MAGLKLLGTIIFMLALGATGVATVSPSSSVAAGLNAAFGQVETTLGVAAQANIGTQVQAQNSKASAGAQTNMQTTTNVQTKTGNAQLKSTGTLSTNSNAQVTSNTTVNPKNNASVNTNAQVNTSTNLTTNSSSSAAVNSNVAAEQDSSLKVATAIANEFDIDVKDITELHDNGWSYDDIDKLYGMAKQSGASLSLIESMRASGKGWGEIAQTLNLNTDQVLGLTVSGDGSLVLEHK